MIFVRFNRISARIKGKLLLWLLRFRRVTTRVNVGSLDRVEEYLHTSLGLQTPRYTDPHQRPIRYFPGLKSRPWYNPADFSWTAVLENAHQTIQRELHGIPSQCFRIQHQGLADAGEWNVYYLYYLGRKVEENCSRCPETTKIIESLPGVTNTGLVYFSVLTEGTHVAPHCGPLNTRLRCHLGVVVPPGCNIRVGTETRSWQEGKCLVFDDSFEHEVWNSGHQARTVLVVDFWHPELTDSETWALREIMLVSPEARKYSKSILRQSRMSD